MTHFDFVTFFRMSHRGCGIYHEGPAVWLPVSIDKLPTYKGHTWKFNKRFKILKGKQFFDENSGALVFPVNKDYAPTKYVTCLGWRFAHGGVIYDKNNRNIQAAMSRHFKLKTPESSEDQDEIGNLGSFGISVNDSNFDKLLSRNGPLWVDSVAADIAYTCRRWLGEFQYDYDPRVASIELAKEIHSKRLLRENEVQKLLLNGEWDKKLWVKYLEWKIKYLEIAKAKKDPRIIVDATVANSLPRVHFANRWKQFTADKEIIFGHVRVIFRSSPNPVDIAKVFEEAWNSTYLVQIIHYSDDAIITIKTKYGIEVYNVDIASNDSSHNWSTFRLYALVSNMNPEQQRNLFGVVSTPFKVVSSDGLYYATFKTLTGYLPSGIGDTSTCNNLMYALLAYTWNYLLTGELEEYFHDGLIPVEYRPLLRNSIKLMTLAGFYMGFRFSYQRARRFEDMQFLKNSAIRRGEKIYSVPNLGILLRYSGCIEGDVPKKIPGFTSTSYEFRAAMLQTLLTYGFFKYYRYEPLLKYLCPYFQTVSKNESDYVGIMEKLGERHSLKQDRPVLFLTRDEFYARYNVTCAQIDEFEYLVSKHGLGKIVECELIDVVLQADYGLTW